MTQEKEVSKLDNRTSSSLLWQPVFGADAVSLRPPQLLHGTNWSDNNPPELFDLYTAGNVLFEIWTRRVPYDSKMPDAEVARRKQRGEFPPIPIPPPRKRHPGLWNMLFGPVLP